MRKLFLNVLLCIGFVLSSCTQPVVASTTVDGITCTMTFTEPLVANASIPVTVRFVQDGQALALTDVVLDLQMPGMTMGSSKPMAVAQTDGSHTTDVLFTMDGEWSIVVTARSATQDKRFVIHQILVSP